MRTLSFVAIDHANAGGAQSSDAILSDMMTRISGQGVVVSGTGIVGTLRLQASNDKAPPGTLPRGFTPTNWSDLTSIVIVGNTAGMIFFNELCATWCRFSWIPSQGHAGTVTVTAQLQGLAP